MSLSSLLEKNLPGGKEMDVESSSVDMTVFTQDSLNKVGNLTMTKRGGKRRVARTVSNSSSKSLEDALGALNESWTSVGSDNDNIDGATCALASIDSREHYVSSNRKSRRGGKRNKASHTSPLSPKMDNTPRTPTVDYESKGHGGRRTRNMSLMEKLEADEHAFNPLMDWVE